MELLITIVIGVLIACGIYLTLRARTFPVVLGLTLMSYAVNLFLFVMGRYRDAVEQYRLIVSIDPASPRSREEILAQSPYQVMSDVTLEHLRAAKEREVRIQVVTNSLASIDHISAFAGYRMQRKRGFTGSFGAVYFNNSSPGQPADSQRLIKSKRTGRNNRHIDYRTASQFHNGTFTKLTLDLGHRRF